MNSRRETGLAGGNLPAVGLMLTSGVCYSVIPLLLVRLGGGEDPFLFNSVYRFGGVVGALSFLFLFYRDLLLDRRVMGVVLRAVLDWRVVWVIIPYFSFTAFAWSLRYVDVTLTTIVQEIWPVFFIILTDRLLRAEGRFDPPTVSQIVLVLLGFIGFIFVVLSQEVRAGGLEGSALWGVGLALVAALMASATSYNYRWAYDLREALVATSTSEIGGGWAGDRVLFFFLMAAFVVGSATSAVVNFILVPANFVDGLSSDNGMGWTIFFGGVLVGGAILDAGGTVFNRQANLRTTNLGVNALGYATPALALVWLFLFSEVHVARVDYLIIGATAIVTANLLINFEAETRWGFRSLLLSLVLCGTVVYVRDLWFVALGVNTWVWKGGGYFEGMTLSATVFTLLLAFRVARLVSRTSAEGEHTFVVFRNLDLLVRRGVIQASVLEHVLALDRSRNPSVVRGNYIQAAGVISEVDLASLDEGDRQLLIEAERNLDSLVRSKQVDVHLGEIFALVVFAALTVALALFSLPAQAAGWTRLLADMFAVVISSVVVFLLFHIFDLQRERNEAKLELLDSEHSQSGRDRYVVLFFDTIHRSVNQYLSMVVGLAIMVTYVVLLGHKWLGWFG